MRTAGIFLPFCLRLCYSETARCGRALSSANLIATPQALQPALIMLRFRREIGSMLNQPIHAASAAVG